MKAKFVKFTFKDRVLARIKTRTFIILTFLFLSITGAGIYFYVYKILELFLIQR